MESLMNKQQIEKFRKILRQIQKELMELFKSDARCCGISLAQCHALLELGISGRTTISILADELALDKSTLSRTIDGLVQQGLVLRNINEGDRRFMSVELSARGETFYKTLNERYHEILHEAFKGISRETQAQLLEDMELFVTILSRIKQKGLLSQIKCCDF
jgi:DNA-binding MarR family transcriptional regulator